ncbi:MAG: CPBP family intramembrane metalloprotease [Bacteroidota bacterium]|jgi:membrane protease YdiL (CAAX protease family)|nr:CPBP family intramembrane metalloprotease [Bacteroidota bacterium]HHU95662.1 CPBP family intramembrane metalloprotease [Petrimonas sp.]
MKTSFTVPPATRVLYLFLLMLAGLFVAGLFLPLLIHLFGLESGGRGAIYLGTVLQSLMAFMLPAYLTVKWSGYPLTKYLKLEGDARLGQHLLFGLLAFLFSYALVSFLNQWNQGFVLPEALRSVEEWMRTLEDAAMETTMLLLSGQGVGYFLLNLLIVAGLAALSEELFFRGALQQFLQEKIPNGHASVWITAFIFSVVHFQFYGFFPRLVLGALLGYLFLYTRNLWVPIVVHFINNATVIVLHFFWGDTEWMEGLEEAEVTPAFAFMALISLLLTLFLFMNYRRRGVDGAR